VGRVVVVGSINVDVVARSSRIPRPGETVLGESITLLPGGKGANQAVAAHRLETSVVLSGAVGNDQFSAVSLDFFRSEGINLEHISTADGATGTALIVVDDRGENSIVIVPGANQQLWADGSQDLGLDGTDVTLLQNEVPEVINIAALEQAQTAGARCILNLAPYRDTSNDLLSQIDYLIVNETEFAELLQMDPNDMLEDRVSGLLAEGAGPTNNIVVTLGEVGLVARLSGGSVSRIAAYKVPVIDTTGAGDCFCGAFAAALVRGSEPEAALAFANCAAAISVQRVGAGPSMPTRAEVEALLSR